LLSQELLNTLFGKPPDCTTQLTKATDVKPSDDTNKAQDA
jgi:hypothetical protein